MLQTANGIATLSRYYRAPDLNVLAPAVVIFPPCTRLAKHSISLSLPLIYPSLAA